MSVDTLSAVLVQHSATFIFALVLLARLGLPIPATPVLLLAGALGGRGGSSALAVVTASALANLLGDAAWYAAGRTWGLRVMRLLCRISLAPAVCVTQSEDLMLRWGGIALIFGKYLPGVSVVTPPMAGALGMRAPAFVGYSVAAGLVWSASLFIVGFSLRDQVAQLLAALTNFSLAALVIVAVAAIVLILRHRRAAKRQALPRVTPTELREALRRDAAPVVVDVRSRASLAVDPRRVADASHIPLAELRARAAELDVHEDIVVYCSCPGDVSAAAAAQLLMAARPRKVRVLAGGLDGWFGDRSDSPVQDLNLGVK